VKWLLNLTSHNSRRMDDPIIKHAVQGEYPEHSSRPQIPLQDLPRDEK
jgi:hypothetical protein